MFVGIVMEVWKLSGEMAPYLLLGFFTAGILHVLLPEEMIVRHLSSHRFSSLFKAAAFGVPLPLCSCGVIPVAAHLEKKGASQGSVLSFLIATPTTGIDSILATFALLGLVFTAFRMMAAFCAGILAGILTFFFEPSDSDHSTQSFLVAPAVKAKVEKKKESFGKIIQDAFQYGFVGLVRSVGGWLVFGIFAGGVISYALPVSFVVDYLSSPWSAYTVMILLSIPTYVCATGSIPIAASLVAKGISPGAGLVFLVAGPATNTATIAFVGGKLGKRSLFHYLFSIIVVSLLVGFLLDFFWSSSALALVQKAQAGGGMLPLWIKNFSSVFLLALLLNSHLGGGKVIKGEGEGRAFRVEDMTCDHCKQRITKALKDLAGVSSVGIDLDKKEVMVFGEEREDEIRRVIEEAGYTVS